MGRNPIAKDRISNPALQKEWLAVLSPMYLRHGIKRYSMGDIAEELGVSKATLYKYFSSRNEILSAIVEAKLVELGVFIDIVENKEIPFRERYENAVRATSTLLAGISVGFMMEVKEADRSLWLKVKKFQDMALQSMGAFYKEGIDKGILNETDPKLLALMDRIFIRAVSDPQFLLDNHMDVKSAFEGYFNIKSKGIFKNI